MRPGKRWQLPLAATLAVAALAASLAAPGRAGNPPDLLTQPWSARWIRPPGISPTEFGVYHFRRTFDLPARPARFVVHVTADNRYELFANGVRVSLGPARGDLHHWRYETVDLAPHLHPGRNTLAAVVWNFAEYAPMAQVWDQTGFLLHGDTAPERLVDTGPEWRCVRNEAYRPIRYSHGEMRGYFVVGPGERFDAARYPWGWERPEYDDSRWVRPESIGPGAPREVRDGATRWMLVPRTIPQMELRRERLAAVRQIEGVYALDAFVTGSAPVVVPAATKARLLLDQGHLTTAYPELRVSGGKGAVVSIGYAESLFEPGARRGDKGNRNAVDGKEFLGYRDVITLDGGEDRVYRPLWWRTFRYVEIQVQTADAPATLRDFLGEFVAYPFERKARFDAGLPSLDRILDVGWRTARLCAHETYEDCPYYEQLQYAGDTRIQCLISLYNAGDARLMRNAIQQLDDSRTAEGATFSRAPTRQQQYIPSFCLWWVGMVHDYWRYVDEPETVRAWLPGVRAVLSFFQARQKKDGSLGRIPWWRYVDWANEWPRGEPPTLADGGCAPLDLQLILAFDWAADLEEEFGTRDAAGRYRRAARDLRAAAQKLYWDPGRRLYADTPERKLFSQQTNCLAVLAGLIEGEPARDLVLRILPDRSLVQCSFYFRHYLHSAVLAVGEGDRYLDLLGDWRAMLQRGMTTWAERPEGSTNASRSDCHAWSAHPNFEVFRTVLGVDTAAPGFRKVVIRPHLGQLGKVSGAIPHPRGPLAVALTREGNRLSADVELPPGVTGEFHWRGKKRSLAPGAARLVFEEPAGAGSL